MKLVMFSKMLKEKSVEELAELAQELGIDGYDLAVRTGYPVNPDNAATALPEAARRLAAARSGRGGPASPRGRERRATSRRTRPRPPTRTSPRTVTNPGGSDSNRTAPPAPSISLPTRLSFQTSPPAAGA